MEAICAVVYVFSVLQSAPFVCVWNNFSSRDDNTPESEGVCGVMPFL